MIASVKSGRLILAALLLFITAEVTDVIYRSDMRYSLQTSTLNRTIIKKQNRGAACLQNLFQNRNNLEQAIGRIEKHTLSGEYAIVHYRDGKLNLWTDNSFGVPDSADSSFFSRPMIEIDGRIMAVTSLSDSSDLFVCFINIWNKYEIENDIVKSGYDESYHMPEGAGISIDKEEGGYPVYGSDGNYLFSVTYRESENFSTWFIIIPLFLWITFISIVVLLLNRLGSSYARRGRGVFVPAVIFIFSAILYALLIFTGKPDLITGMDIFSPYRFTMGRFFPSPGHMFIAGLIFVYTAWSFYKWYPVNFGAEKRISQRFMVLSVYLLIGALIFLLYTLLVSRFINGSNINFEIYKVLGIDYFTIVAFLSSAFILAGLVIYLIKVFRSADWINGKILFVAAGISASFIFIIYAFKGDNPFIQLVVWSALLLAAWLLRNPGAGLINMSVVFGIIAGAYASYIIPSVTWERETENLKVMAVNYSTDNDLYAESILHDVWEEIYDDSLLISMMGKEYFTNEDADRIYDYLDKSYFSGYWENYDRIYTICNHDSKLILEENNDSTESCFGFFSARMEEAGIPLSDSGLVFIENNSGRAYYLGCAYFNSKEGTRNGLFIELINKIKYIQAGYPELLVDRKYFMQPLLRKYSIAKYVNDTLVMQTGVNPFDPLLTGRGGEEGEYFSYRVRDIDYMVFNRSDSVSLVIARPALRFLDILVTFTYFFVGFFLLFMLFLVMVQPHQKFSLRRLDFRHKMQFAFVLILLGTMIAVGGVVIYLSMGQYRAKHLENIREKLSSVNIELEHKLSSESSLDEGWNAEGYPSLDELLIKFSNVFYTDINLYDSKGNLLASSRREVFDKALTGRRMNYFALDALSVRGEPQFIHEERIGDLSYLSAYLPFYNTENQLLAYLNLPYFTIQSKLTEEISNLVVAIINFSLILLVISMGIAVFISGRITSPLRMLQGALASVQLGRQSEPLEYRGHDEIGELVKQYNIMLAELHESAIKLARSEREDAWREMAKQIAHEIKNPLTPMKLNVQQLYKTWRDSPDDFESRLARFTENQIEQIDNLSSIATEFSNFARMPKAKPGKTDLISAIRNVSQLFSDIRNIELSLDTEPLREVIIYADREHLSSMLTNLFRNAVQAIPSNRKGHIDVRVSIIGDRVRLSISDNGSGIPAELKDKLFIPNFTTKSSGMGLGLSIVKRIVETANGRIWFESEIDKGSTFSVEYPVISFK